MSTPAKTGAYGHIAPPQLTNQHPLPLPLKDTLKDGTKVQILQVPTTPSPSLLKSLHTLLNAEIEAGNTYPHEWQMQEDEFKAYFLSATAFYVVEEGKDGEGDGVEEVLGTFYVKPNYPGRCSHICNGGFITAGGARGRGVGKVMGRAFTVLAPLLGYRASIFNLVFVTNVASVQLWRGLGFSEVGRIPGAGRLKGQEGYVDAIVFHYDFMKGK